MKKLTKFTTFITTLFLCSASGLALAKVDMESAKAITTNEVENSIASISYVDGYNGASQYLIITLSESDFGNISENGGNDFPIYNYAGGFTNIVNFANDQIQYNGAACNLSNAACYLVYKANPNSIGIEFTSYLANVSEGDELFIPKGTSFPTYAVLKGNSNDIYVTKEDAFFYYESGNFRKEVTTTSEDTSIKEVNFTLGYDNVSYFLNFLLTNNDYADITENAGNDYHLTGTKVSYLDCSNFARNIIFKGEAKNLENRSSDTFLNYRGNLGGVGIKFPEYSSYVDYDSIVIPKGTTFPSYSITKGLSDIVYQTTEEQTFTYLNGKFHQCISNESSFDNEYHWDICSICGNAFNKHTHNMTNGYREPTCSEDGLEDALYCLDCSYVENEGTVIPALGHSYTNQPYLSNFEGHWQECSRECGHSSEIEPHTFGEDGKTCTVCGYFKDVFFINLTNGYFADQESNEFFNGTTVTVIADTPKEGMRFFGWFVDNIRISKNNTYSFTAKEDLEIEARFTNIDEEEPVEEKKGCKGQLESITVIGYLSTVSIVIFFLLKKKEAR